MTYTPINERKQYDGFGRIQIDEEALDTEVADIRNPTNLSNSVGESGQNNRQDVAKVETMLGQAGALDLKQTDGPTGYWGVRTAEATKKVQAENGLTVDAEIKPNGPTIKKLDQIADTRNATKLRKERRERRRSKHPARPEQTTEDPYLKTGIDVLQSMIEDRAREKAQERLTGTERRRQELKRRNEKPQSARPSRGGGFGGGGPLNPRMPTGMRKNRPIFDDWVK